MPPSRTLFPALIAAGMMSCAGPFVAGGFAQPIPPVQAVAVGYTDLMFDDEFTSPSTISPNGSGSYNWYATNFFNASATLPASGYSVANGYLTIKTDDSGYSDGIATAAPGHTAQAWQHGYFEASIAFNPAGNQGSAWPAFWSWSIEDATGQDESNGTRGPYGELDFMEAYPIASRQIAIATTIHQWLNGSSIAQNSNNGPTIPPGTNFNQFHTYGCLWTPDQVVWYFDNKPVTTVKTGPGTSFTAIEKDHMFIILGTGKNWPMYVDYVHVWQ